MSINWKERIGGGPYSVWKNHLEGSNNTMSIKENILFNPNTDGGDWKKGLRLSAPNSGIEAKPASNNPQKELSLADVVRGIVELEKKYPELRLKDTAIEELRRKEERVGELASGGGQPPIDQRLLYAEMTNILQARSLVGTLTGQDVFGSGNIGPMSEGSKTEATDSSLAGGTMPVPKTGETPKPKGGFWGGVRKVLGIPDKGRHVKAGEAAKAVVLGTVVGAVGGEVINNAAPVQSPNPNQAEVIEAPIQSGGVDLTEKPPTPWIAGGGNPTPTAETPTVTPNPNLDPRAKALLDLSQEQRNLILTDTINVAFDADLGELTFTKGDVNYRFDPERATEGNPETGLIALVGKAKSADGRITIFIDSDWSTRNSSDIDPFKTLNVSDQDALQVLADIYAQLSSESNQNVKGSIRLVLTGESVDAGDPGWQVLTTENGKVSRAVRKTNVGNQKIIFVHTNNQSLRPDSKSAELFGALLSATIEDSSPDTWKDPSKIQEIAKQYNTGSVGKTAFDPVK